MMSLQRAEYLPHPHSTVHAKTTPRPSKLSTTLYPLLPLPPVCPLPLSCSPEQASHLCGDAWFPCNSPSPSQGQPLPHVMGSQLPLQILSVPGVSGEQCGSPGGGGARTAVLAL